ncbi:MAG TPA: YtxH domain-containing protein [Thermoanaerobaculia bacterium]|jgi:gas vesicle protein|nr:YtxH domain-containing protein [Thermoanaerobaculia bacterium]
MFERKSTFKKYLFTFVGGIASGVILGLLYAPVTGKKMQKKVADVTDQVIDRVDDLKQTVRKFANA